MEVNNIKAIAIILLMMIIFYPNKIDSQEKVSEKNNIEMEKLATFGSGCFWCSEAIFQSMKGVSKVVSGYSGGDIQNPTYKMVTGGQSGHAEVIQITYNPSLVSYQTLLEVFWKTHDPTTLNKQGNDVGPQYRSIILYHDEEQRELATKSKEAAQKAIWKEKPIVTEIEALSKFYEAEEYHQDYYRQNKSYNPYCYFVIKPKIEKFRKEFERLLSNSKD